MGTVLREGDSQEHIPTLRCRVGGGRAEGPDRSPWVGAEGMQDATAGPDRGEIHRGMLVGLALSLPSMGPMEAPEPPLFSRASAAAVGMGVPTHLPAYLLHGRCVGGHGTWGEWGGCLPSLSPPKTDASGSKILLLEVLGELQEAFSPCPPGAGRRWGGQGRARGWLEAAAGG